MKNDLTDEERMAGIDIITYLANKGHKPERIFEILVHVVESYKMMDIERSQ